MEDCLKVFPETVYTNTVKELENFQNGGVNMIFTKISSLEKYFTETEDAENSKIQKNSVAGMFFRKLILAINTLDFTSQVQFSRKVEDYVNGVQHDDEPEGSQSVYDDTCTSMVDIYPRRSAANSRTTDSEPKELSSPEEVESTDFWAGDESLVYGRDKARAFLRDQGQKLKDNPAAALPPKELHREILQILRSSPDMAEAYYLSFMNNLFFGEYVSAIGNCHKHFLLKRDIAGKKFRYALLNLAMIHKRFGHENQAELALRESIDLSQQAGDHECLQQALVWLCRTNQEDISLSVKNSVVQSWQQHLWLLLSLGLQTLSKLGVLTGRSPSTCFEILGGKHLKHSDSPAILMNYGISAAILWISFGFHQNARLHCEMVLHICHSKITLRHNDWVVVNENVILAFVFCSRYAIQDYDYKTADKLLEIASSLVPSFSELKNAVDIAVLCNECEKNLHRDCFVKCEAAIESLGLLSPEDARLYKVRMYQQLGNYEKAIKLINAFPTSSVEHCGSYGTVIKYLLKSRVLIDIDSDNSFQCILEGLALCERYNLRYLECMFKLELVRAQGRSNFSKHSLQSTIDSVTPMILAHGSKDDKLLLRSIGAEISDNEKAIEEMIACYEEWNSLGDIQRSKVALNFIARKCHEMGDRTRRNYYSKLFKILVSTQA